MAPLAPAFWGDAFQLRPADPVTLPLLIDSNTPSFWNGSTLQLFSSTGSPILTSFGLDTVSEDVQINVLDHLPLWIESIWQAPAGPLYAWYHHENVNVCGPGTLDVPEVGALVSYDGGNSFTDLGIVLNSGAPNDCSAQNGYFANGHGDFSVILDQNAQYFYFLFTSYGGDLAQQGIGMARMSINNLTMPVGAVQKYYAGEWSEPGLGGRLTPIFPAAVSWGAANADSFWGPSIHWNTYLQQYVVLMNRACCSPGWPQEGIYLTTASDLSEPKTWNAPVKILEGGDWYPWALGMSPGETSSQAGQTVRLFVRNSSEWEIVFQSENDTGEDSPARRGHPKKPL